jgi:hypothetical protein
MDRLKRWQSLPLAIVNCCESLREYTLKSIVAQFSPLDAAMVAQMGESNYPAIAQSWNLLLDQLQIVPSPDAIAIWNGLAQAANLPIAFDRLGWIELM